MNIATPLPFPNFSFTDSRAPHPVWAGSTRLPVKFAPLAKKLAVKIYHDARRFERQTRNGMSEGCIIRQGKLGLSGLSVLHALLFDFLNYNSGRLDPSYAAIADKACVSMRTVARCIKRLRDAGVLNWVRRCSESYDDRRYVLSQDTNAYGVVPSSQWRGYRAPPEMPSPQPGTWGDPPPRPPEYVQAAEDLRHGLPTGSPLAPLAGSLARLAALRARPGGA